MASMATDAMTHYLRFVACLAIGLVGLSLVLKVVIETLFHDWDIVADLANFFRTYFSENRTLAHARTEDLMLEKEAVARAETADMAYIDVRRQQLKDLANVESRLKRPVGPVVLTPIPPKPALNVPAE